MESIAQRIAATLPDTIAVESPASDPLLLCESNPLRFWGRFLGAIEAKKSIVLMDPTWPKPWLERLTSVAGTLDPSNGSRILIPTSGSTGIPKFCIHDTDTLTCAAKGYAERFGARGLIHAVNILPQHHIGGLMPVLRSAECGGKVHFADYRDTAAFESAPFPPEKACLSVVPTQLGRMLTDPALTALLRRFGLILVGGAACPREIIDRARSECLRLSPCYGSTETAAMVSAMDPEAFIAGTEIAGTPLPHAKIEIDAASRVLIRTESLLRGYWPEQAGFCRDPFVSGDLGKINSLNELCILGRTDRVIITGGKKVDPEQVEAAAMATGLVEYARCRGIADPDWGSRVELTVGVIAQSPDIREILLKTIKGRLPAYAVPKVIHFVEADSPPSPLK